MNDKPKKPLKEDYKDNFSYRQALKKYNKKLYRYNLSYNPEQRPDEPDELYKFRMERLEKERKKSLNPQSKAWESLKEKQDKLPFIPNLVSEIITSPIDIAYHLKENVFDTDDTGKYQSKKTKRNENIEFVDSLTDASTLIAPWNIGLKATAANVAKKKLIKEAVQETAFDKAKEVNNEFSNGGLMNKFNEFNKGGSHESNKYGGIPMNRSSNGKMNTVEQDETSFDFEDGKYIFSDRLSFDIIANKAQNNKETNDFNNGGLINPDGPGDDKKKSVTNNDKPKGIFPPQGGYTEDPFKGWTQESQFNRDISYPMDFVKKNHRTSTTGAPHPLQERRDSFMAYPAGKEAYVDFDKAINNETSRQFLDRYNHPVTRQRLKDQAGIDDAQIDNMILQGLHPELIKDDLGPHTNGAFMLGQPDKVYVDPSGPTPVATETHERIHSSNIDSLMGIKLQDLMGSSFKQNKSRSLRYQSPSFLEYMNRPHESYANFADFRESLGLKPGEQIDEKELEKRVKAKKLEENNFYKTYDNKKVIEALNTIAHNSKSNNKYNGLT